MTHCFQDYVQWDKQHDEQAEEREERSRLVKMEHILLYSLLGDLIFFLLKTGCLVHNLEH